MTKNELSDKYLSQSEIHTIDEHKAGTITVYYRMLKGNSMGAWEQAGVLKELIEDAAPAKVELIDSLPARLI